jgi:hypothetical protein
VGQGHAVRGTSRDAPRVREIELAGAQGVRADPNRLSTLLPQLDGVAAICWLMGGAVGDRQLIAGLHGTRLRSLLEKLVDTPVRGFVYEAAGPVQRGRLSAGVAIVRDAGERWQIPVEVVTQDPDDHGAWLEAMRGAVGRVLAGG